MDSGVLCLLIGVLGVVCVVLGAALAALHERVGRTSQHLAAIEDSLGQARLERIELQGEVARHRVELAALALRGEALRETETARVGPRLAVDATDEQVVAAVQAAASETTAEAAANALKPVVRAADGSAPTPKKAPPPVVTPRKLGVDDLEEHDIRNALGNTVRPVGQPAARPDGAAPWKYPPPGTPSPVATPSAGPAQPNPGGSPTGAPPPKPPSSSAHPPFPPASPQSPPLELPSIEKLIGGFAAALAGLLFAIGALFALGKAIEAGWFGPSARFAAALVLAVMLWAISGLLRWRKFALPANALAGSGTAIAYGAIYAGHAVYGFLPQSLTTASFLAITAISMFAAARKDAGLWAAITAIGGFATPLMLSTGENAPVGFFGYLFLLNAGILYASRKRGWWWLVAFAGTVTAAMHIGWGIEFRAPDMVPYALGASLILGVTYLLATREGASVPTRGAALYGGLGLLVAGMPFLVPADPYAVDPHSSLPLTWTMGWSAGLGAAFVIAMTVLTGVFSPGGKDAPSQVLRVIGGSVAALGALVFGFGWISAGEPRWDAVTIAMSVAIVLSTGLARWRGPELGAGPVLAAAILLAGGLAFQPPDPMWMLAFSVALTGGALVWALSVDLLAPVAAIAAIAPLVVNLPDRLTPFLPQGGYALMATMLAFQAFAVVLPFRLRPNRYGTATAVLIAGPLAFWSFHLLWQAGIGHGEGALGLILALHAVLAARIARVQGVDDASGQFAALLVAVLGFAALAIPLQLENGWLTVGWSLEVAALAALSRRYPHPGIKVFGGLLASAVAIRLLFNPYVLDYGDGNSWKILNWTLYTWGVPGVAFLVAAALLPFPDLGKRALRVTATFLFFALINLEVAHYFARAGQLSFWSDNLAESMTRSIAWGLFGLIVLVYGMIRDSRSGRVFGFAFMLLAALKVGLVDVISLPGWFRIGSVMGLGVFMLIASVFFLRVVLRDRKKQLDQGAARPKDTP